MIRKARGRLAAVAVLMATAGLAGCRADTVTVAFRPRPGARFTYRINVHVRTETRLRRRVPAITVDDEELTVGQTVLSATAAGADLRVVLEDRRGGREVLRVHYDRADHLAGIERENNLPVSSLGGVSLAEIFPASIDAPPAHPLRSGDAWPIDAPLELATGNGAAVTRGRVHGRGRLVELSTRDAHPVAVVRTTLDVPVEGINPASGELGPVTFRGAETTTAIATRTVPNGLLQTESATTLARFSLLAQPPPGVPGPAVPGTLAVMVEAKTVLVSTGG